MSWLTQDMVDELALTETIDEAIGNLAVHYFRQSDASEDQGNYLSDHIFDALEQVQMEVEFQPLSEAVERSFNRLRLNGYRCEQNWQCCMTCGWAAIPWEHADQCVWYHSQDRDCAMQTGRLFLAWQGDAALIREAFEAEGLTVEHDGTIEKRFQVWLTEAA